MDIANPLAGQRKRRRKLIAIAIAVLLLAGLAIGAARLGPALPTAERSSLWIDAVQRGTRSSGILPANQGGSRPSRSARRRRRSRLGLAR